MRTHAISAADPFTRQRIAVLDSEMAYVDIGRGNAVVFLHGNPTSSYVWRNIIPHLDSIARCLAPDLMGMGDSGPMPNRSYRFLDHARYLDAWFDALNIGNDVVLVGHDWGAALAFHWARRHPESVRGLVYMEAVMDVRQWRDFPPASREVFERLRSPEGEDMILRDNYFVEKRLADRVLRGLTDEELAVYRRPFERSADSRLPTLVWAREVPIEGEPEDVAEAVEAFGAWLRQVQIPKLFIRAEPGAVLSGSHLVFCRSLPNQREVVVPGIHFPQEDAPHAIGGAIVEFVKSV